MAEASFEAVSEGRPTNRTSSACVYTTLIGDYEKLNEQPVALSSRLPFVCLTDDHSLQSKTWQLRHVKPLFGMDFVRSQRVLKLRPHEYLPTFDRSLYIDNSVVLKIEPERLIDQYLGASGLSLFRHSFRDSVLDEFLEVAAAGLDDHGRVFEQLSHYMIGRPDILQEVPYWTGIMFRDHRNLKVQAMLDLWWAHVQRYSRRDQLSINFAFSQAGLQPDVLQMDISGSWFHSWPHIVGRDRSKAHHSPLTSLAPVVARLKRLEQQNEALNASLAPALARLSDLEQQNEALRSSTSWRLTTPLRAAAEAYRSFANGDAARAVDHDNATSFVEGFVGPLDLFTRSQCHLILKHYRLGARPVRAEWPKDLAANDPFFYELAKRPQLLALLKPLLGDDIVLWGAAIIERDPGQTHIWHTDIESSASNGRFISVWVGLENTSCESALQLISRSHKFGKPIQQEVHERGLKRGEATDEMVTTWAREHDRLAAFVQPEMGDGQALLFDGRLWHASHNESTRRRSALLLQYAAAGTPITIPVYNHFEWPFRFTSATPPVVLVCGKDESGQTPRPPSASPPQASLVETNIHSGEGFLESADGWIPYPLLHGPTPLLAAMESHVSVLSPGHSPHPPHCHVEEELLIVLNGEAEIVIADGPDPIDARAERLGAGSFVYYPAYQYHTIRNSSASPVTYLMFKWQAAPTEVDSPIQSKIFDIGGICAQQNSDQIAMRPLFDAPTAFLHKLHAHVTDLQPGAGYPAHSDEHDVAIVTFSGAIETLGKAIGPGGSVYYSAGQLHGMRNVGDGPSRYLVFEFHGPKAPM